MLLNKIVVLIDHKDSYRHFCIKNADIPLFFNPWWLDIVCHPHTWDVAISYNKDGVIQGVLPYFVGKKCLVTTSIQALLTPYLGPYIIYPSNMLKNTSRYSHEVKVMDELISQLPNASMIKMRFLPEMQNWLSFYNHNFQQNSRYTYRIHPQEESIIESNLKSNIRNYIHKSDELFQIKRELNVDILYDLNESTFRRKQQKTPFSKALLSKMVQQLDAHNLVNIYTGYRDQVPVASIMVAHDLKCSYCLLIGLDKSLGKGGAVQLLLWEAIKDANKAGRIFDFEGSMIPEVEPVFRAFGGVMTPYHVVSKSNNWLAAIYRIWKGQNF